jgi:nucleotide-binding universal stress UspA family protein
MRALHLSITPLVGAPGNICRALREHHGVQARWCVQQPSVGSYDKMVFDLDLTWDRDRDEVIALARDADVLHLHNFIDLPSTGFAPIDLAALWRDGKPMVRHFHSTPQTVARYMRSTEAAVQACPIPKLVIAQYPERYYPTARVVPNVVFAPEGVRRQRPPGATLRIGYAPSRFNPGRSARWDTKGYPETCKMLRRLQASARRAGVALEVDLIERVSHAESLRRKADCDVFIDDLVTGSYHLNTLESLVLGVACMTYLDGRMLRTLFEATGRVDFPVINAGLEHAHDVLLQACRDPACIGTIGAHSQQWMRAHWPARAVADTFVGIYRDVMVAPHQAFARRFGDDAIGQWVSVGADDALWAARSPHWPRLAPEWLLKTRGALGKLIRGRS